MLQHTLVISADVANENVDKFFLILNLIYSFVRFWFKCKELIFFVDEILSQYFDDWMDLQDSDTYS